MKQILNNITESLQHVPYTFKHICVLYKLQWKYLDYIKFPFHDMDKLFMYIFCGFLGVKRISKIHRKYVSHHLSKNKNVTYSNVLEAVLDWESARYTKPDKPLNAWETCLKYYPEWESLIDIVLSAYNIPK